MCVALSSMSPARAEPGPYRVPYLRAARSAEAFHPGRAAAAQLRVRARGRGVSGRGAAWTRLRDGVLGEACPGCSRACAARAVLRVWGRRPEARIAKAPTEREKGYLRAVEILYGEGDKVSRDIAEAMRGLKEKYPDDLRVAHPAVALLGVCQYERQYPIYMQGGGRRVRQNPQHPGAIHYLIHAYDDPVHCVRTVPARCTPRSRARLRTRSTCRRTSSSRSGCGPTRSSSNERLWRTSASRARASAGRAKLPRAVRRVRLSAAGRHRRRAAAAR